MKTTHTLRVISLTLLVLAVICSVRADSLTNNFTATFDYVANGIIGDTNWDGVYTALGDIPLNNDVGGNGPAVTQIAGTATAVGSGYLGVRTSGTDWAGGDNDGFFIWKLVAGDFDMSVQVAPFNLGTGTGFDNRGNNFVGLMARAYHTNNSGAPYGFPISTNSASTNENYVMIWRFNEFSLDGEVNEAINGGRVERTFPGSNTDTNSTRYYRIVRSSLTNFTF